MRTISPAIALLFILVFILGCGDRREPAPLPANQKPKPIAKPIIDAATPTGPLVAAKPVAPAVPIDDRKEAIAALASIIRGMETKGTDQVVNDFEQPGKKWRKRRQLAIDARFDVKKTDSVIAPFKAEVTWLNARFFSKVVSTREEAERLALPDNPKIPSKKSSRWNALFNYTNGKWVVQDVWWNLRDSAVGSRYSTQTNPRDPIVDWWHALGGVD